MDPGQEESVRQAIAKAGGAYERGFSTTADNFKKVYSELSKELGMQPDRLKGSWAGKNGVVGNRRAELLRGLGDSPRYRLLILVMPANVLDTARADVETHRNEWAKLTERLVLATSTVRPTTVDEVSLEEEYELKLAAASVPSSTPIDSTANLIVPDWFEDLAAALRRYRNVLIEGVPGTGKTHAVRLIKEIHAGRQLGASGDAWAAMTLHPSVSYEDFVEGLRPALTTESKLETSFEDGAQIRADRQGLRWFFDAPPSGGEFKLVDGFLLRVCKRAAADPHRDFLVLLDELNRANVSRVLGDLLTTLESSRRARWDDDAEQWNTDSAQLVTLPYSSRTLFVPENVYIVATVNGTDRSLAPLDDAIRRRFASLKAEPLDVDNLRAQVPEFLEESLVQWAELNEHVLRPALGPNGVLGHSYFFDMAAGSTSPDVSVRLGWRYAILSQLCSVVERTGAEELIAGDGETRREWISRHAVGLDVEVAIEALHSFDGFLAKLGLEVRLEGTGLERRLSVVDHVE